MNKKFTWLITLLAALMVTTALAETDYLADKWVEAIKDGEAGKSYGKDGILRSPKVSGTLQVDAIEPHTSGGEISLKTPQLYIGTVDAEQGYFGFVGVTQLVFVVTYTNGVAVSPPVTNAIDADITSP